MIDSTALYCLCMIRYYAKKSFNEEPQLVEGAPTDRAWIYASKVTDLELDQLTEQYKLDSGIVKDVRDRHELPRAEYSDGALYVFMRMPHLSKNDANRTSVFLAILKGNLLLTLSREEYLSPEAFFEKRKVDMRHPKHVFLQLAGEVISQYSESIHQTGKYIHSTEGRLTSHEVTNGDFVKFVAVERNLNDYKTNLTAIHVLLTRLHDNRHDTFADSDCEYIEDMLLLVNQLLVSVESHAHAINSIRNAYMTISNNRLNKGIQTLTLLTLLITLPNVFYGMYGMNVDLPFMNEPWAYGAVVTFTAVVVLTAFLIFRRLRF